MAQLVWRATSEALEDAQCKNVEAIFVGTCFGEPGVAQRSLHHLGLVSLPISIYENACASSHASLSRSVRRG